MPELPDLECIARNLHRRFAGDRLHDLEYHKQKRLNVTPQRLRETLRGRPLERVARLGKRIRFHFDAGDHLTVHLMLSGGFLLLGSDPQPKSAVLTLELSEPLVLVDPSGLTTVEVNGEDPTAPDALDRAFHGAYLKNALANKTRKTIKDALLDQEIVQGVGNAYADEILWEARIHPHSVCSKVPTDVLDRLVKATQFTLKAAIREIHRRQPDILSGELRDFLKIHNPENPTAPDGSPIHTLTKAGRKTYFTESQTLYQ